MTVGALQWLVIFLLVSSLSLPQCQLWPFSDVWIGEGQGKHLVLLLQNLPLPVWELAEVLASKADAFAGRWG